MTIINTGGNGGGGGGGGDAKVFAYPTTNSEAQDIVDRIEDGYTAIIMKDDMAYSYQKMYTGTSSYSYLFEGFEDHTNDGSNTVITKHYITILTDSSKDVTSYLATSGTEKFLDTNTDYGTPYNPTYDGSPATKAYVDHLANPLAPYDLSLENVGNLTVKVSWNDPADSNTYPQITRQQTVLVRKIGSAPTSPSDGTVVLTETTRNNHTSELPLIDDNGGNDLQDLTTYYYRAFALFSDNKYYYGEAKSVYVYEKGTITITWTENSNPAQFNPVYSDDAENWTAGSTNFDKFFGYSAVLLDPSGNEVAEVTQQESGGDGKLDMSLLAVKGALDGSNNVMIKFPKRGIKMSKNGSTVTLSITKEPNVPGYQYYAHTKFSTVKPNLYLSAYYTESGYKSISGATLTPLDLSTRKSGIKTTYDSLAGTDRYSCLTIYPRFYILALYMMKYGNPNVNDIIGIGRSYGSEVSPTGSTNSLVNATDKDANGNIRLFGLENFYGKYLGSFMDGVYVSNREYFVDPTNSISSNNGYIRIGSVTHGYIGAIHATNEKMFFCSGGGSGYPSYSYVGRNNDQQKSFVPDVESGLFSLGGGFRGSGLTRLQYI